MISALTSLDSVLASLRAALIAFSTPDKISLVVGLLAPPKNFSDCITTASVFVPPTSTPILIITNIYTYI